MQTELHFSEIKVHKRTKQKIRIIKKIGNVAICELVEPYEKKIVNMFMKIDRAVCSLDSLM